MRRPTTFCGEDEMKVSEFSLLATLPNEYDYSIFEDFNGSTMIIGKNHQTIIGFRIIDDKLHPIKFECEPEYNGIR